MNDRNPDHGPLLAQELGRLHGLARRLAADEHQAMDLVQDAAVEALRSGRRPPQRLRPWLATVMRHRAARLHARDVRRQQLEQQEPAATAPATADVVATAALHRRLGDEVMQLREPYRMAVVLRYLRDLPLHEVAAHCGVPSETARTRIKRGLDQLRSRLDRHYGDRQAWTGLLGMTPTATVLSPTSLFGALLLQTKTLVLIGAAVCAILAVALFLRDPDDHAQPIPVADGPQADPRAGRATPTDESANAARSPADDAAPAAAAAPQPAALDLGDHVLWGEVVARATGQPVANAHVHLLLRDADDVHTLDLSYGRDSVELAEAITDQDGRFRFDVQPTRPHRLRVVAAGFAEHVSLRHHGGAAVRIALATGAIVSGRVTCAGAPLADVTVDVARSGESLILAHGATDSDGCFRFDRLQEGRVFVKVRSRDHDETWKSLDLVHGEHAQVDIDLPIGRTVRGRISDADSGAALAAARVSDSWTFQREARCGADGTYALRGVRRSSGELYVQAPGYVAVSLALEDGRGELRVDVALRRGGTLVGRLLDPDGRPLADAYCAAGASFMLRPGVEHTDWRPARIEVDGRFRIDGLDPEQRYALMVHARGHGQVTRAVPWRIDAGATRDLGDVVLQPGAVVRGRVVDGDGTPVAGVSIALGVPDQAAAGSTTDANDSQPPVNVPWQMQSRSSKTAANGSFVFGEVAEGSYRLHVRHGAAELDHRILVRSGVSQDDIELCLTTGHSITGRVVMADGSQPPRVDDLFLLAHRNGPSDGTAQVCADGSFRFDGLSPEPVTLVALQPIGEWTLEPMRGVVPGQRDLRLLLTPTLTLSGQVVDADGHGISARVWCHDATLPFLAAPIQRTDSEGRFVLRVPRGWTGSVHAARPDSEPDSAKVVDGLVAPRAGLVIPLD